jgi:dTDP-4-dehydrorhamnose reductase
MKVLLTGAGGQLGGEIIAAWRDDEVTALDRAELDVTDRDAVEAAVAHARPELVINTAAFTAVDACEADVERAFTVNAFGALHLADACAAHGAALMHISTDYVFDGRSRTPYGADAAVGPMSVYGLSKATGEQLIRAALPAHYIVRTAGLYGPRGARQPANFVERMLQLAREGQPIRVVDDQVTAPTYARDLAVTLRAIAATGHHGTYHATNAGACSWYEFAAAIFELAGVPAKLERTTTAAYGAPAARPAYSVLANDALAAAGIAPLRHWREALAAYVREREDALA